MSPVLLAVSFGALSSAMALPVACDDLPWADQDSHTPGGNGTQQAAFSWHVHYLHQTTAQESEAGAFQKAFCAEFGKYGTSVLWACKATPCYGHVGHACSGTPRVVRA